MDDIRVFEVDMRILDNDGFAFAAIYDTIVAIGQLDGKLSEMEKCIAEMDAAVEGINSTMAVVTSAGSTAQPDAPRCNPSDRAAG